MALSMILAFLPARSIVLHRFEFVLQISLYTAAFKCAPSAATVKQLLHPIGKSNCPAQHHANA